MKGLAPVLGACAFASGFGIRIVDPMVPLLSAEFAVSLGATSLLVTAFAFSYALGQPILGPLADAIGKTRLIVLCGAIVSVLFLACALAPAFPFLAVVRGISGFAAGGIIPVAIAALSDSVSVAERQVALGRFLVASILGQMLGAAVSGVVSELFGWRAVFLLTSALMAAAITVAFMVLPHSPRVGEGLSRGSIFRQHGKILSSRRAVFLFCLVILGAVAAYGLFPFVAAILFERFGTGTYEAGLVLGGFGLGGVLYALTVRRVIGLLGPRWMSWAGGLGSGAALIAFAFPLPWTWNIASFTLLGFAYFMLHNKFQTHAAELAPGASGSAISLFAFCIFAAQGIGPLVVGGALSFLPIPVVLTLMGALVAGVGVLAPWILSKE
ncbi:MFS transporter [Microvirga sp. GCM10011540]|uniref:MFS transporter n=1 Tax=Microvirga sp. GCM10011540 TaxID=3317338 RepID=UPI0036133223